MKPEINFFSDSNMSDAHPFGSEPHSNSPSEMGMSQHHGDMNYMARQMYNIARSHQEQFAMRAHETALIRQETQSIHHPVLGGFQQPAPAFGAPAVTMVVYFGGGAAHAARFAGDVPFMPVWNGAHAAHSYHMDMLNTIPSGDEQHDDLGTGLATRNFLGAMEQPLNPGYANQALQTESPEPMTAVTEPVVNLDPEEVDLNLKL